MTVRVLFLGPLSDIAPAAEMNVDGPLDWAGLLNLVSPECANQIRSERVKIACAGKVLLDKADLHAKGGDEVAVLPPVSGG